jgi:hypothetical protein
VSLEGSFALQKYLNFKFGFKFSNSHATRGKILF